LLNMPVTGEPVPGSEFTALTDLVAARAVGSGPLHVAIDLVNVSTEPYRYNFVEWTAESLRKTQRVAMGGQLKTGGVQWKSLDIPNAQEAEKSMLDSLQKDLEDWGRDKLLEDWAPDALDKIVRRSPQWKSSLLLRSLPLFSHAADVYGLITGKDILSGEELSPLERAACALGTIPGIGTLGRLGIEVSSKTLRTLLNSKDLAKDILDFATSDTVQNLTQQAAQSTLGQRYLAEAQQAYRAVLG
ncbi:MAG: pre-toxin TG domain-containing protein, partial [Rhodocyclaceae bacterium]|nr:pre-toxin TG domain-containing protein [Rhodocyclaceae bacterium]